MTNRMLHLSMAAGILLVPSKPRFVARARVGDVAFSFRMGTTAPGTVNRTHPATIEPALNDPLANFPLTFYGQACLAEPARNTVRAIQTSDSSIDAIYGISVRPYPNTGVPSASLGAPEVFGGGGPFPQSAVDILRAGYITVKLSGSAAAAKGGRVWIYTAVSSGAHVLGGFEAASGSNLVELDEKTHWNGPADANGFAEIAFNI